MTPPARARVLILVLDGMGVGATGDTHQARPSDVGANSLAHALERAPAALPTLKALGLRQVLGDHSGAEPVGAWGSSELGYHGADSYRGHLELMGADARSIREECFGQVVGDFEHLLLDHGHQVRRVGQGSVLLVDEAMCVADSLEADPGLNYNVTGSLLATSFERLLTVARLIRSRASVNRVIAVGGTAITVADLLASLRRHGNVEGVDTASLGVYRTGVVTRHLGFPVPGAGQLQAAVVAAGRRVTLIGKAADLLECAAAERFAAIETRTVFDAIDNAMKVGRADLIVANVQELDLAGHQVDPAMYVDVLSACDSRLAAVIGRLEPLDCLIVTSDHGNDPTRGAGHTRERVPVLAYHPGIHPRPLGLRTSLADVSASASQWLGLPAPLRGHSFLGVSGEGMTSFGTHDGSAER